MLPVHVPAGGAIALEEAAQAGRSRHLREGTTRRTQASASAALAFHDDGPRRAYRRMGSKQWYRYCYRYLHVLFVVSSLLCKMTSLLLATYLRCSRDERYMYATIHVRGTNWCGPLTYENSSAYAYSFRYEQANHVRRCRPATHVNVNVYSL